MISRCNSDDAAGKMNFNIFSFSTGAGLTFLFVFREKGY